MTSATFARKLLSQIVPAVTAAGFKVHKDAWVINTIGLWEFHGPGRYYWYGKASNAYEARYKGWSAYLESRKPKCHTLDSATCVPCPLPVTGTDYYNLPACDSHKTTEHSS